jgi:hypothetical protein
MKTGGDTVFTWGVLSLGVIMGLVGILIYVYVSPRWPALKALPSETETARQIAYFESRLAITENSFKEAMEKAMHIEERLKDLIQAITAKGAEQGGTDIRQLHLTVKDAANRITEIGKQSKTVEERMARIEGLILADPLKAIELPLMKRDLQSLQSQLERDLKAVREETSRVYETIKWIVGLMGFVSLGLIGLAVGNLFKGRAI